MEKVWKPKPSGDNQLITELSDLLEIDSISANMLIQRGITTYEAAHKFFQPELTHLYSPFLMKDMDKAIERIEFAIKSDERILIYGDYDVDGTTAVAMVYHFLHKRYSNIDYYIPDRYSEGYGISFKAIDFAQESGVSLIIALDCGIKSIEKVDYANRKKIDFIICDHHNVGESIPRAIAVLDPKRPDCKYPFKELSGCGVGFKLLQGFVSRNFFRNEIYIHSFLTDELAEYLDLVCVSIASDIVPIVDENRILAFHGLKQINLKPRTGLKAIMNVAGITKKNIDISDCVFKIGPRINAAGRIEYGKKSVELLISDDEHAARDFSEKINSLNSERKDLDTSITHEALRMIGQSEELQNRKTTVLYKDGWHKGVLGIVASRLTETYYRPTIILTRTDNKATGSARSVYGYNLYNAIEMCSDLLENFGGHYYAAGVTMKLENVEEFQRRFEEIVSQTITQEQLTPVIDIDAQISFTDINEPFFKTIRHFEPFGPENMTPVFVTKGVISLQSTRLVGKNKDHLKLDMLESSTFMSGIAFHLAEYYENIRRGNQFDISYTLDLNEFEGNPYIQLNVRDIK